MALGAKPFLLNQGVFPLTTQSGRWVCGFDVASSCINGYLRTTSGPKRHFHAGFTAIDLK